MSTRHLGSVLLRLRRGALADHPAAGGDAELLEAFLADRDQLAFESLLRRHGPMVLGVCRRVLPNQADAEDAFQAVFLVLVRKASSIQPRHQVGNWLYGVALKTARKARTMNLRRRVNESRAVATTRSVDPTSIGRPSCSATWKGTRFTKRPPACTGRSARWPPGWRGAGRCWHAA